MVPVASIEHQLPGRVRLRVPSRRGDVPFFEKVVRELSKHPSLRELTASPLTGSITVHYREPLQLMTTAAAEQKLFELGRSEPQDEGSKKPASTVGKASGAAGATAAGLSGLGLFQVARGNMVGSAVENLWHAYAAQRIFGRPEIALLFAGLGIYQVLRGQLFGAASSLFFYALILPHIAAMEQARGGSLASVAARTVKDVSSAGDSEEEAVARAAGSVLDKTAEK
jgi:Heavy metal associated domain 2